MLLTEATERYAISPSHSWYSQLVSFFPWPIGKEIHPYYWFEDASFVINFWYLFFSLCVDFCFFSLLLFFFLLTLISHLTSLPWSGEDGETYILEGRHFFVSITGLPLVTQWHPTCFDMWYVHYLVKNTFLIDFCFCFDPWVISKCVSFQNIRYFTRIFFLQILI